MAPTLEWLWYSYGRAPQSLEGRTHALMDDAAQRRSPSARGGMAMSSTHRSSAVVPSPCSCGAVPSWAATPGPAGVPTPPPLPGL